MKAHQEMFRVLVDFDEEIPLTEDSLGQFAQLMKTRTLEEGMAPLTAAAAAPWFCKVATSGRGVYQGRAGLARAWVGQHAGA